MSKTILLADDSVTIQKVVELTFLAEDYQLESVSHGDEAMERLKESFPDLVIADVHMPGASGYDLCRRAKGLHPETPVILLVGTFESFDEAEAEACGADGHLKKPFDSQELLQKVEQLMDGSVRQDGSPAPVAAGEVAAAEPAASKSAAGAEAEEAAAGAGPEPGHTEAAESPGGAEAAGGAEATETAEAAGTAHQGDLSEEEVDRIARRVVELLSDQAVREVAWEVVPDLAEVVIRDRLQELESQVD